MPDRNSRQALAGRTLKNAPTVIRQDTQEFEFARFRFDYFLQEANPKRDSKNQISKTISTNSRHPTAVENPPPSIYGRKRANVFFFILLLFRRKGEPLASEMIYRK